MYKKIYRLNLGYRILVGLVFGIGFLPFTMVIVVLFAVLVFPINSMTDRTIYTVLCSSVFFIVGFWQTSIPRIVVSDLGIEYYNIGYSIKATWDEVESYKIVTGYAGYSIGVPNWGLWLRKPALKISPAGWALPLFILSNYDDFSRSIPLVPFGGINWQNSPLMSDVKRYLPHLFKQ